MAKKEEATKKKGFIQGVMDSIMGDRSKTNPSIGGADTIRRRKKRQKQQIDAMFPKPKVKK